MYYCKLIKKTDNECKMIKLVHTKRSLDIICAF